MRALIYKCPVSGLDIQGVVPEDMIGPNTAHVPVYCPICKRPHLIDPATGRVPGTSPKGE